MLNLAISKNDLPWVEKIIDRADELARRHNKEIDRLDLAVSVVACHLNGCPLRLASLASVASDFDFTHDVWGIHKHLDRETGKLKNAFLPRFHE